MTKPTTIAILGAGIAGVATAYYLLQQQPHLSVVLIDRQQPLSFTTSKSGENFRTYWPQEVMAQFVGHSIDLMEGLRRMHGPAAFQMVYSGYQFVSHQRDAAIFGINHQAAFPVGVEEVTDAAILRAQYPYLDPGIQKMVICHQAGKIDVYALGSLLLREARQKGLQQITGTVVGVDQLAGQFEIALAGQPAVRADKVVIATGPFLNTVGALFGLQFPILNTLQRKFILPDPQGIIPRDMPFTIYADPQYLDWTAEEQAFFAEEEGCQWLLDKFPGGLHLKPEGTGIKMGWAFQTAAESPRWEHPPLDYFPLAVLKGASRFIPQLAAYVSHMPAPVMEYAGYYTRTRENWPLIGATSLPGVYVVGALAGFGTMAACAAGELAAQSVLEDPDLPTYAACFHPNRYHNPAVMEKIRAIDLDGQL
ncbi:MAG: hypothetical protein DA408_16635 [Bacteroidetes bacterium]|nr:MAG: hypothetical protein DA408_16635 [Bacteroidota bacterium]